MVPRGYHLCNARKKYEFILLYKAASKLSLLTIHNNSKIYLSLDV